MQSRALRYEENSFWLEYQLRPNSSLKMNQKVTLGHIVENLLYKAGKILVFYLVDQKPIQILNHNNKTLYNDMYFVSLY